jgi:hypothetical protein
MNRPDHEVAAKVVEYLNRAADELDSGTRERLATAREKALSRYRERAQPAWLPAWAPVGWRRGQRAHGGLYLTGVAALVIGLAGLTYWHTMPPPNDFSEVDLKLLTDDLPINAYLDSSFDSWLKRASR